MSITKIWLAGGCFWGLEEYFYKITGVISTKVGYCNGKSDKTSYKEVKLTGHSETVEITYDNEIISLEDLLQYFYAVIDPVSINKQGNDTGTQYRTGIYYSDISDLDIIRNSIDLLQREYSEKIAIEIEELKNFVVAEEYHQKYLRKNPDGYCHIDFAKMNLIKAKLIKKKELKTKLTPMQYRVTQENSTEPPYNNEYYNNKKKGLYVDIVDGTPLFISSDKFDSGCGWPSFSKPIQSSLIKNLEDRSLHTLRTEVSSKSSDAHLGHVFTDGPKVMGGLRYCINSAALKFIPYEKMEEEGYKEFMKLIDKE